MTFKKENGTAKRKILRFIPTRWLSMTECLERITQERDNLTLFYDLEVYRKEKLKILKALNNSQSKAKCQLFLDFLKKFKTTNVVFQKMKLQAMNYISTLKIYTNLLQILF